MRYISCYVRRVMYYVDKKGQGLLETIVALGIIMSALVAVLSLVISNLITERAADMRLQALNFAREGIEAVKNVRDTNYLTNQDDAWFGISSDQNGRRLNIDFNPDNGTKSFIDVSGDSYIYNREDVYLQKNGGYSSDSQLIKTPFSRVVVITDIKCDDEFAQSGSISVQNSNKCKTVFPEEKIGVNVDSVVSWTETGRQHEITLTEKLYDWR